MQQPPLLMMYRHQRKDCAQQHCNHHPHSHHHKPQEQQQQQQQQHPQKQKQWHLEYNESNQIRLVQLLFLPYTYIMTRKKIHHELLLSSQPTTTTTTDHYNVSHIDTDKHSLMGSDSKKSNSFSTSASSQLCRCCCQFCVSYSNFNQSSCNGFIDKNQRICNFSANCTITDSSVLLQTVDNQIKSSKSAICINKKITNHNNSHDNQHKFDCCSESVIICSNNHDLPNKKRTVAAELTILSSTNKLIMPTVSLIDDLSSFTAGTTTAAATTINDATITNLPSTIITTTTTTTTPPPSTTNNHQPYLSSSLPPLTPPPPPPPPQTPLLLSSETSSLSVSSLSAETTLSTSSLLPFLSHSSSICPTASIQLPDARSRLNKTKKNEISDKMTAINKRNTSTNYKHKTKNTFDEINQSETNKNQQHKNKKHCNLANDFNIDSSHSNNNLKNNENKFEKIYSKNDSASGNSYYINIHGNSVKRWPYAISSAMKYTHVLLICIAFIVFGIRSSVVNADDTTIKNYANITEGGICTSKDIRNSPKSLSQLKDCRVIEGFLMISLIDKYNESDYDGMEFPLLTEVTEFVLLYRVNGLKSLLKLFPNLRIIRGNSLINDFAFVIFELMHLQEIGLKSLTQITRGAVRIEKNPSLCFVDTIDWAQITSNSESKDSFIKGNKPINECPICPSGKKTDTGSESSKDTSDMLDCPEAPFDPKQRLCWNRQHCQVVCPSHCGNRTCNEIGQCCDESCIGCEPNKLNKCLSCRYLSIGDYPNRQCVQKCPALTYEHENRRCVQEEVCRNVSRPVSLKYDYNLLEKPYIPYDGKCVVDCPSDHYPDGPSGHRICKKCVGKCKKECSPGSIDSIASAQRYRGCTHITGSFVINIRSQGGLNVVRELETFLSDIEVIEGSLKIIRSFPILSLSFFKKLNTIKGNPLESDRYSLYVVDNQNLQALFPQNVTIERGRLFFHFNPKLCPAVIEKLKDNVVELRNVAKLAAEDVAPNSNGDKTACNVTIMKAELKGVNSGAALIHLTPIVYDDERSLLGYVLYYMAAPYQNVSLYDGRDACGGDGWRVDDITNFNRNTSQVEVLITHLKPYTQYAYYIKTYTVASEPRGGQTPIQYFRTSPDKPDPVTRLTITSNGSYEITVKWEPPIHANGNLTKYIIKCTLVYDDLQLLEQRNYCNEPLGSELKIPQPAVVTPEVKPPTKEKPRTDQGYCSCDDDEYKERVKISDSDAEQLIAFENELHNTIYVRQESVRRRREIIHGILNDTNTFNMINAHTIKKRADNSTLQMTVNNNNNINNNNNNNNGKSPEIFPPPQDPPKTSVEDNKQSRMKNNEYYEYIYTEVNASVLSVALKQLRHYSYYTISVKACREGEGNNCSNEVIAHQRTAKIETADDVEHVSVDKVPTNANHSSGSVRLSWSTPKNPNSIIVSYTIRYQRVDIDHAKYQEICVTHNHYRNQSGSHIIPNLLNGNYSFMVMAISLAGPNNHWSSPVYYNINESTITLGFIMLILSLVAILLAAIGFVFWFYRRKYGPPDSGLKLIASVNPEYVSMQYQPDEWEIPREKIIQLNELGQGSFGMVYEGILLNADRDHERIRCAIKTVNENATDRERINFLKEAAVMKAFDTHHVVRLLGVVSRGQPVLVIMELMVNGDLKGYLRSHRPEAGNDVQPPTLRRILQMAIEIADGMAYLSAKKFVHRDLAARNCMVAEDLTVKIGDFGMTRDIYETDYYRKGTKGLLPVRWMAPESLKDGVFSSSSDVFSFGIVLWEMATLASQPYQGLSNDQVLRYVIDGGVMERPENCPEKLYNLMCRTWQHRPSARPTFLQIVSMLLDDASPNFRTLSFYHSQPGQELLQLPQHQLLEVVDVRTPLRAEEENFSVGADDEEDPDPNSFLMENRNLPQPESGPSNSPLRNSGFYRLNSSSKIPDVAQSKSIQQDSPYKIQMPSSSMSLTSSIASSTPQFAATNKANLTNTTTSTTINPSSNSQSSSIQERLLLNQRQFKTSLPKNATDTSNTNHLSFYGRNGITNLNRGIGFLRNALFGSGGGGGNGGGGNAEYNNQTNRNCNNGGSADDAKDYNKLLNHSINSQSDQYIHPLQKIN